jgi:branched-chain amino acid transport system substrate-binding protein
MLNKRDLLKKTMAGAAALPLLAKRTWAQGESDPGISATAIRIGGTFPLSGPASAFSVFAEAATASFNLINSKGGIQGRKIEFVFFDDAYEPSRTVANVRRLVESEQVFALYNVGGTAHNLAIQNYINEKKVPSLYPNTGAAVFEESPDQYPWTRGYAPSYGAESGVFAEYLKNNKPNAKIAILYQNDAFGKDLLGWFERYAAKASLQIIAREGYHPLDPSIDTQISKLARSGADTLLSFALPKFVGQAIRKNAELDWKPLHIVSSTTASIELIFKPAGLDISKGIMSALYIKDASIPQFAADPAVKEFGETLLRYFPNASPRDNFRQRGWIASQMLIKALEAMKAPTRAALMEAANNLQADIPMLLPGIRLKPRQDDFYAINSLVMSRLQDDNWILEGEPITPTRL